MSATDIFTAVDGYIEGLVAQEDSALTSTIETMRREGLPEINISAAQGKFLYILAKLVNARRILEMGTLGGYSAIWLARALPENGRLITLELEPHNAAVARRNIANANLANIVEVREGPALELLPALAAENPAPFDMVFIDADKPPYLEYFEWAVKLTRPGALIIADNVIRQGRVIDPLFAADPAVIGVKRLSEALSAHPDVESCIVQSVGVKGHDGMVLAIRK